MDSEKDFPTEDPKANPIENKKILDEILQKPAEDLIPWEECTLPSRGVYYDGKIPNGVVEVKAWGIQTDKILATQRLAQTGQSLDYMYKKCVRLPNNFDHANLIVGDRMFLLYYLRGITYGNIYEFIVECNNEDCERAWTVEYDLNKIAETITTPNSEIGLEPFKVVLPYLSEYAKAEVWVKVRFLRGYDLAHMMQQRRFKKGFRQTARSKSRVARSKERKVSEETLDKTIEENLKLAIVEAMGDNDPRKIDALIERMHSKDTSVIREFLRANTPGIDTMIEVQCPDCGNAMTIDLPITESFFRPTERGGPGERVLGSDESVIPAEGIRKTESMGTESIDG